jgi:hypothetical protein
MTVLFSAKANGEAEVADAFHRSEQAPVIFDWIDAVYPARLQIRSMSAYSISLVQYLAFGGRYTHGYLMWARRSWVLWV